MEKKREDIKNRINKLNEERRTFIEKAEKDIQRIAEELLEVYASRKLSKGFSFTYFQEKQKEFQNAFPYIYTHDQSIAIDDILKDMESEKNMDRLLV